MKKKIMFIRIAVAVLAATVAIFILKFKKTGSVTEYLELGENYMDELNYEEAVVAFKEAIRLDPKNVDASLALANAYEGAGQYEQAEATYLSSVEKFQDNGKVYEALAELYIRLERLQDAKEILEEAVLCTDDESVQELYEKTRPEPPEVSLASGTYDTWQKVELSSNHNDEIIYYTLDGENALIYQEPIILPSGETTIRAKVVNDRGYESDTVRYEYVVDREAREIMFEDIGIERAVREKLDIWYQPVTDEDMAVIQSLSIVGDRFESGWDNLSGTTFTEEAYLVNGYGNASTGYVRNLRDLVYMPYLTELNIAWQENLSLKGIESCRELKRLSLLHDGLSSVEEVQQLTSLEYLSLGWNQVSDLTPVAGLTGLQTLSFWGNRVSDLTPVQHLVKLTCLDFSKNQVEDLSPVSKLTELQALWMYDNQVTDLGPLTGLEDLSVLMFRDNPVEDMADFRSIFPRLTRTDVSFRRGGEV